MLNVNKKKVQVREKEDGEGLEEWDGENFQADQLAPILVICLYLVTSLSFVCIFIGPESDLFLPLSLTDD